MWKVSLLVTTYNVKEQAKITLDSIGQQDYPDIEVIIVDGKSQDGTLEVIRDFAEKYGQSGYDSQTAQGGGGHRPAVVDGPGALHRVPGGDGHGLDGGVLGEDADDLIHRYRSFLAAKNTRCAPGPGERIVLSPYTLIWEKPASRRKPSSSSRE